MRTRVVLSLSGVAACALLALPGVASASKVYPTITKVSPLVAGIGDTLTLSGKNFRAGKNGNTVVFKKDGGQAIFIRVKTSSTKQISVKIPAKLLPFLHQKGGAPIATRFRLRVLASHFGKSFTSTKLSPKIGPTPTTTTATKNDCDGDGIPNSTDTDDDNDLLPDTTELQIGTDPCKRDTDGDGMSDGWEYQSALDRNNGRAAGAVPSPNRKPYPNPLDKTDGNIDADGDGLTNAEEYTAWATFSNQFRTAPPGGSVLTYSGGNPASDGRAPAPANYAYADRDGNGFLTDFERDADGDGIPNMDEGGSKDLAGITQPGKQPADDVRFYDYGLFTQSYITQAAAFTKNATTCTGINQIPFYCADQAVGAPIDVQKVDPLDWLSRDTDGDSIPDGQDDQDHDGVNNITEYLAELAAAPADRHFQQLDACIPNADSYFCLIGSEDIDKDGIPNRDDTDDDGDGLPDTLEKQIGTNPLKADTDGDGVSDGFEYYSAIDLNSAALPYPGTRPYPNPLDGTDANSDFDQDSLTMTEEYKAWQYTGGTFPLTYSDGTKYTGGKIAVTPATQWEDLDGNGFLSDDEKDVDNDGLTNFDETHGRMRVAWWQATYGVEPYNESKYPGPDYLEPSFVNPDSDGDGIKDGADDQDHDGYTNAFELARPANWTTTYVSTAHPGNPANPLARVQPFNPCKPTYSDACHTHPPLGYYQPGEDWASPIFQNGP